jgi:hypothetical protein
MKKAIFLFTILISNAILACECPPVNAITKELCKQYDVIFSGRVDSIIPCSTKGIGTAFFTITELYKGSVEQHVAVDYDCTSDCLMSFSKCDEWIVYAAFSRFNQVIVNICSNTRKKVTGSAQDFYSLQTGQSYEQETAFLKTVLGTKAFAIHNQLNDQQVEMRPHNDQPTGWNKLWLLLTSFGAMAIVYIVSKKYFKK